ncbi:MAG: DUF3375 domain-containing protein [Pseudomonadota bacterium]|nr:DUF3375 domain-containing protein [Pseudomonadota bacterium]
MSKTHPAWRLLTAEHAPLIISFIDQVFIQANLRDMSQADLVSRLEDVLYQLREQEKNENIFPRPAKEYLDDWAQQEKGWLTKFYPPGSDDPYYDISPSTEKVVSWIESLLEKNFIGTESRLLTVFELLRQIVSGVETNKDKRIEDLMQRRQAIDLQIEEIESGNIPLMDKTAVKDRFMQFSNTARGLLSDFRTVEQNFRQLDRKVREDIATWNGTKGELLEHVFGDRDAIANSDQGKSFRAFWDFLMSSASQQELTELLEQVCDIDAIAEFGQNQRLKLIHFEWLEAGEHTQRMVARLSQQLRRYLDDQAWLENKRIMAILDNISQTAISVRETLPKGAFMQIHEASPDIVLPMERPMFSPAAKNAVASIVENALGDEVNTEALFNQIYVDNAVLQSNIHQQLQTQGQVTLQQVINHYPLQQGLAELVAYLALAGDNPAVVFDENVQEQVEWQDTEGYIRTATLPRVIFNRKGM